jgi:2-amino-4-hydroxy-6-hydroxymethyldihydropteridine diphosphokinase
MALVYIGIGSNLGDPLTQVTKALEEMAALPQTKLQAQSKLYRSLAVGPGDQPDYINAVALLETDLAPLALLDALQAIEQSHHRVRLEHWGPRTLDLDILLFDQQEILEERLTVPHPYLSQRNFVLYPLADIDPNLILPNGSDLAALLAKCPQDGLAAVLL